MNVFGRITFLVTVFSDKIVDKIVSKSLLTYVTSERKIHQ